MYPSNQMNGLGEVRQGPNGQLYQLGEVMDGNGNIGLGWQPYTQPQLGEVRRGTDGQFYQYGVDGLGNVGFFGPLASLAAKALPAIAQAIPGVSSIVNTLAPGLLPPTPGAPVPSAPVSATVSVPAPAPMPAAYPQPYPFYRPGLGRLIPRIAEATAQMVVERIEPLLTRRSRRGRRGRSLSGIGEEAYPYGIGEDPYLYGMGERDYENLGISDQDLGLSPEDLGENDPYLGDSIGYSDYPPLSGVDGYQRQEPSRSLDGYVKGPISSGPAFVSRETPSELWKPLW